MRILNHCAILFCAATAVVSYAGNAPVHLTVETQAVDGVRAPGRCVLVSAGDESWAIRTSDQGIAAVTLSVPDDEVSISAKAYYGRPIVPWLGLDPAQGPPDCPYVAQVPGVVERTMYFGSIDSVTRNCHIVIRPVASVTVSAHLRDQAGMPVKIAGGGLVGSTGGGACDDSGLFRVSHVLKSEPTTIYVTRNGEQFLIDVGICEADKDLGEIVIPEPTTPTAPVMLNRTSTVQQYNPARMIWLTLVSASGAHIYTWTSVKDVGWVNGGPTNGSANLVVPGEYFVLPGSLADPRTADMVLRIRSGKLAGTESLPRVTAVENEVRSVHIVVNEVDREVRRILQTPQPGQ